MNHAIISFNVNQLFDTTLIRQYIINYFQQFFCVKCIVCQWMSHLLTVDQKRIHITVS